MGKKRDWAIDQAKRIVNTTKGLSEQVCVNYIASELRLAHQCGAIEAGKTNGAAPAPVKAKTTEKIL